MTQATMMDAWAKVGAEHGDPPMLLERDGDKSIYWMHGKKGEYDGVYAIWRGTTFTCYRSRDEAWNAWETLKDDRAMRGDSVEDEEYTAKHKAIIAQMRNREIMSEEARRRIDELTKEYIKSRRRKQRRNG